MKIIYLLYKHGKYRNTRKILKEISIIIRRNLIILIPPRKRKLGGANT